MLSHWVKQSLDHEQADITVLQTGRQQSWNNTVSQLQRLETSATTWWERDILTTHLSAGFWCGNKVMKCSIKRELPFSNGTIALQTSPTETLDVLLNVDRYV